MLNLTSLFRWLFAPALLRLGVIDMSSDGPDMSGVNAAAQANADIARQALDFYRSAYQDQAPLRQQAADEALASSRQARSIAQQNADLSTERVAYERDTFRPLERRIVADAEAYDTPERRESAAQAAAAGVSSAFDQTRQANAIRNASMGVNPNSGRAAAMDQRTQIQQAAAQAGASNAERARVETVGAARRADAANMGRNLPSQQATNAQIALQGGAQAANLAAQPVSIAQSGAQMAGAGFNTAIQGNQSAGQMYGQIANTQASVQNSNAQVLGGLVGAGLGFAASDVTKKEAIEPYGDDEALSAVSATPVTQWKYKPGAAGAPQDGATRVGPMAQDVAATMGEQAAPGGKALDLVTMNGITMKAIQAVNKKVDTLTATIAQMAQQGAPMQQQGVPR